MSAASKIELIRHMQWWILRMCGEEIAAPGRTGMPEPPAMSHETALSMYYWLADCAAYIAPDHRPHYRGEIGA